MSRVAFRILLAALLLGGGWLALRLTVWKFPPPPGVVITHSLAPTGRYIGSPSFLVLPDGEYLASHDFFGPGSGEQSSGITRIFSSKDRGKSWEFRSEVRGAFWSVLFAHRGAVYLLGVDRHSGSWIPKGIARCLHKARVVTKSENSIVIRRSDDGGRSWTEPLDENTGRLKTGHYGFAPTPVIEHAGRLWRAQGAVGMMSVPVDADLLKAASWRLADEQNPDKKPWFGGDFEGWGEGNAVVAPGGGIVNLAKVRYLKPGDDHAAIVSFDPDGKQASFDPARDFVKMPGARVKFTVRFDPVSGRYWALTNYLPPRYYGDRTDLRRNTVALVSSTDLREWRIDGIVLENPDTKYHGFQYLDWAIEGDDIIAACRTAWPDGLGGPVRQHDANYLTFQRLKNFRSLSPL